MKRPIAIILILSATVMIAVPAPVDAGGKDWLIGGALLGGFLLGSVLGQHDHVVVGPPVYYPPVARWIPEHYELRWQKVCETMYYRPRCYQAQITVFIPGHWEY